MEDLSLTPKPEKDDDDEEEIVESKPSKKKNQNAVEDMLSFLGLKNKKESTPIEHPEDEEFDLSQLFKKTEKSKDDVSEDKSEAHSEKLSEQENEQIAKDFATERLGEIAGEGEELSEAEAEAAEIFLQKVEATGDIDKSFEETIDELSEIEDSENAETKVINLRQELSDEAMNKTEVKEETTDDPIPLPLTESYTSIPHTKNEKPRVEVINTHETVKELMSTRKPKVKSEAKIKPIKERLEREVKIIKEKIIERENVVERVARVYEESDNLASESKINELRNSVETVANVMLEPNLPIEKKAKGPESKKGSAAEVAQSLSRAELLEMTDKVIIDGTSLRQIYEGHLIGEKGIRRIVAVYLRGGNIKRALRRELVQKEIDFERDPKLRDKGALAAKPEEDKSPLNQILKTRGIDINEEEDQRVYTAQPKPSSSPAKNPQNNFPYLFNNPFKKIMDLLLILVIIILIGLILKYIYG